MIRRQRAAAMERGSKIRVKWASKPQQVWAIRFWLDRERRLRDVRCSISRSTASCAVRHHQDQDRRPCQRRPGSPTAMVVQQKTGRPVQFELLESPAAVYSPGSNVEEALSTTTPSRAGLIMPIRSSTRQYARLVDESVTWIRLLGGLRHPSTPPDQGVYHLQADRNLRAVQILLGHTKIESTVRYLGVDIEDALALAEGTEV